MFERKKCCFFISLLFFILLLILTTEARRKHRRPRAWKDEMPKPFVEVINSSTVRLLQIPTKSLKPNCLITKYTVKVREEKTNYVMTKHIHGGTDQLTIRFLDPESNYSIRILPRDCNNKLWTSDWISFTTAVYPIPTTARLTKTQAFATSIFVSWAPPSGNIKVDGYVVGYGEGVPEVNWQYLEGNRTNMTIKNLKKNTQYVVSVRAYNTAGKGPAVYEVVQTKDDVPDLVLLPPFLKGEVVSSTSISLKWSDPSLDTPSLLPEDNRYYSVNYKYKHPQDGREIEKNELSKKLEMVLNRLYANTQYMIRVRTLKDGRAGDYSPYLKLTTSEAPPPHPPSSVKVSIVKIHNNDTVDVSLSWQPPKLTNGDITSYRVQYTDKIEAPADAWMKKTVKEHTGVMVHGLRYGDAYYFRVQARNSRGFGPNSFIKKFYTKQQSEHNTALLTSTHSVGNKTKRDQSIDNKQDNQPALLHVDFKVMLQVKINGFITWPEEHPSSECDNEVTVSSYKFQYHKVEDAAWHEVELNVNMYVMENLELNTLYEYKVGYTNEESTVWTKPHQLSTSPDQHEPID